jgi:S-adenosylmethionine-diacylglycerol 3-amino-3-carboxypropyl transferase
MDTSWLTAASALPVAFAQVREDSLLDHEVIERLGRPARVMMVASGGCTAVFLAASLRTSLLHLVDPNPAQLALARLKLRLLVHAEPGRRLALLGHTPLNSDERRAALSEELDALGQAADALGPPEFVAQVGADHVGRYERLFVALREALRTHADDVAALLQLTDCAEQARRVDPATALGRALDDAFDTVMALPNLVRLFGEGATRNRVEPFARHFARRTRQVLATLPAASNPYLWQLLRGRFPAATVYPWLRAAAPVRMPEFVCTATPMATALAEVREPFDVVHLSNILDWLAPEEARHTLELAGRALRPGGFVVIRQLNSTLDIPSFGEQFQWQSDAAALHARDRSFFYRGLHIGRRT